MRIAVISIATAVAAAAVAAQTSATPLRAACTPGSSTSSGVMFVTFCGSAKAVVQVGGKTYRFKSGKCSVQPGFGGPKVLAVNIGTQTLPPDTPKRSYFGLLLDKAKPGTYTDQAVSWQVPGKGFAVFSNKVTVAPGLKKGSFSGRASVRLPGNHVKGAGMAEGSFTC